MAFPSRRISRGLTLAVLCALPLVALISGEGAAVPFLAMPALLLGFPLLLSLRDGTVDPGGEGGSADDPGSDDGGGGNRRPDRGPSAPSGPRGELPLSTSSPSSWRLRGGVRQRSIDPGRRRQPHPTPARRPRRVPAGPHTR